MGGQDKWAKLRAEKESLTSKADSLASDASAKMKGAADEVKSKVS